MEILIYRLSKDFLNLFDTIPPLHSGIITDIFVSKPWFSPWLILVKPHSGPDPKGPVPQNCGIETSMTTGGTRGRLDVNSEKHRSVPAPQVDLRGCN